MTAGHVLEKILEHQGVAKVSAAPLGGQDRKRSTIPGLNRHQYTMLRSFEAFDAIAILY